MARFLIEIKHSPEEVPCARVVKYFLTSGSHFLTNADWGCRDGEHSAWMIVDVENKDQAKLTIPVPFRADARIVGLNYFDLAEIDAILARGHA